MPDWDIYVCDAFDRPSHLIGDVMGAARTHEDALAVFLTTNPDNSGRLRLRVSVDDRAVGADSPGGVSGAAAPARPATHLA